MSKKLQQISVPLISVFLGILLGAIVMWIFGYDAIWGYEELFYTAFGSLRGIGEIFRAMGPLVLIGLGLRLPVELVSLTSDFLVRLWQVGFSVVGLRCRIQICPVP